MRAQVLDERVFRRHIARVPLRLNGRDDGASRVRVARDDAREPLLVDGRDDALRSGRREAGADERGVAHRRMDDATVSHTRHGHVGRVARAPACDREGRASVRTLIANVTRANPHVSGAPDLSAGFDDDPFAGLKPAVPCEPLSGARRYCREDAARILSGTAAKRADVVRTEIRVAHDQIDLFSRDIQLARDGFCQRRRVVLAHVDLAGERGHAACRADVQPRPALRRPGAAALLVHVLRLLGRQHHDETVTQPSEPISISRLAEIPRDSATDGESFVVRAGLVAGRRRIVSAGAQ